ncbi:B-box type zinc finger protein ncl-1 isoform X2 [Chrysoperla carnea]|uniref:B-box type zinc finger protein ncl-1 isoform X2 n=1 Tax=Chrysoperla carnea TaxID=189513 RepID=UPI001D07CCA2|nr:B-box type zinc finger protein ncl-1 isoform X2 [Chrysoperla carnea]
MASNELHEDLHKLNLGTEMFGESLKNCADNPLEDGLLGDPDSCGICGNTLCNPRVLSCLHVFCEPCLDKKLIGEAGDPGTPEAVLNCPICNQATKVGSRKVASLPLDLISTNIIDVTGLPNLSCTSCSSKELAVSRCCTCHNLLCSNCNSAHQYMRCFECHRVLPLDEIKQKGEKICIHKPIPCTLHPSESLLFYCATCQIAICAECAKLDHMGHQCEAVIDAEQRVKQELETLLAEGRAKASVLTNASAELDISLNELAHQRSAAKDLINESYQSYKAVLEKCRDDALNELNELHHERELKLMDLTERVGKDISLVDDACKFTSRLLEKGNTVEIMCLKKIVGTQLMNLINNTSKPEQTYSIEFETDFANFKHTLRKIFGKFRTEMNPIDAASSKDSNSPSNVPLLPIMNGTANINLTNGCTNSLTNSSPISLPTSMQSSFDGEIHTGGFLAQPVLSPDSPPMAPVPQTPYGFTSMAEYNLQQLASLAERETSAAPSPTPSFTLADLFTGDLSSANNALNNLQALAKLGLNSNTGGSNVNNPVSSFTHPPRSIKLAPMQIRCKFGQLGPSKGQFNSPHGFCLGTDEDIVVADTNNHRVQIFEKTGTYKFQFGIPGKEEGQLWYPRKVAVMRTTGKFVVCDRGNERSRMQIFTKNGHFIKKIAIRYIDIVAGLAVTPQGHIVAVDSVSPTVFVISETGDLLRWFDCSDFMREPSDIAVHGSDFYVCDFKGHNVVVFSEEGQYLRRIGCENITNFPNGIDISDAGDVLIGDSHGNRFHVAVFSREGNLITEFECPYVKVSRCCGLKITSEGYVVTLAKNNHHVLVLNTLYIM